MNNKRIVIAMVLIWVTAVMFFGFVQEHPGVFADGNDCKRMHEVWPHTVPTLGQPFRIGSNRWEVTGVWARGAPLFVVITAPGEVWELDGYGGDRWQSSCSKLAVREYKRRATEEGEELYSGCLMLRGLQEAGVAFQISEPERHTPDPEDAETDISVVCD